MIRVLFVDDDPEVLDNLRHLLHRQEPDWDMVFLPDPDAALDELAVAPADVVVSDMQMPGMGGAGFLARVRDLYPGAARIVLSGEADKDIERHALPFAHQYLGKPCRTEQLVEAVNRTASLYTHLDDPVLRGIVSGLDRLPTVPQVYFEITRLAADPEATLNDISASVERDPALVAKILQMGNSAWFGRRRRLTSIREAVQYLGTDVLRGLALGGQAFGTMAIAPFEGFSLEGLQRHSLHTARLAARLLEGQQGVDDVFTTAMVHDIGQVVLAAGRRREFAEVRRRAKGERRPFHEVEYDAFGATHAGIGAYLLGMWGLPFPMVEATAYHHNPRRVANGERRLLAAVHLADVLMSTAEPDREDHTPEQRLDIGFLDACGIRPDLPRWSHLAREEAQAAG
jgi:HD-like signal output (HDOD) protein/ActR/RegA family two-component response regulator